MLLQNPPCNTTYPYHDSYSSYSYMLGECNQLSGTSDNDEVILTDRTNQSCSVQTRNMSINTDPLKCNHFGNFRADPKKSSSILYHVKKTLGIGKTRKKMRDNIDVKQEKTRVTCTAAEVTEQAYTSHITPNRNTAPEQKTPTRPKVQTTPIRTPQASSPHVVQTTVTAHVVSPTAPPHATPDPPSPCPSAPEEDSIQYEPETKPTKQGLYPHLSSTDYPLQQHTPQLTPQHGGAMFSQQIFGTHPGAPPPFPTAGMMPGGGMMPNVPFMWFPYGVPFTPTTGHMPSIREEHHVKRKKGGTLQPHEHNCIDPTLLSKDLIRHVKRSCGLDKTRSRIAARAIIQCLEDSISETVKIQLLSEILTAMDNSYRSRREEKDSDQRVVSRRKRNRPDEVNDEEPTVRTSRKHRCKRAVKEEKVLMEYLQHVLEILESMSEGPGKENSFHMYYNLANQLLDTMYTKLSSRAANDYDIS